MDARGHARDILALASLVVALLLPWLGATELTSTDESRYTEVAREMRASGRWLSPVLNGEEYWEKPALLFDLLQLPQLITGRVTPAGSRLVVVPFAIAATIATYGAGRILAGRRAGFRSAAILATSTLFAELAGHALFDVPMLAAIATALAAHVVATRTERSPARWHLVAALAMGVGCLFKGPVAILLPGAVMAADSLARRGLRALRTSTPLWMPLVALLVLGVWVVPMALVHGSPFVDHAIGKHIVDRSVGEAAPHAKGALFYLPRLLVGIFPWSLALPAAIAGWRVPAPASPGVPDRRDSLRFSRIWAIGMPLVLSLIASKRSQYLLPALPGFALWLGIWIDARRSAGDAFAPAERRAFAAVALLLAALAPFVATALPIGLSLVELRATWAMLGAEIHPAFWGAAVDGVAIAIGAATALLLLAGAAALAGATPRRVWLGLLALGIGAIILRQGVAAPHLDRFERPNEFGAELRHFIAAGGDVGIYGLRLDGTYLLHSGATRFEPLYTPAEVAVHLAGEGPRAVLGKRRYLQRHVLPELPGEPPAPLLRHGVGRREVLLLGNRRSEEVLLGGDRPPER